VEHVLGCIRFWRKNSAPAKSWGVFNCWRAATDLASLSRHLVRRRAFPADYETLAYNRFMERKVFWMVFMALGLVADFLLPLWWGIAATIPIVFIAWWVAYRSDWF
jgi:hypothetical protein